MATGSGFTPELSAGVEPEEELVELRTKDQGQAHSSLRGTLRLENIQPVWQGISLSPALLGS